MQDYKHLFINQDTLLGLASQRMGSDVVIEDDIDELFLHHLPDVTPPPALIQRILAIGTLPDISHTTDQRATSFTSLRELNLASSAGKYLH